MTIIKNGKTYAVKENRKSWTVSTTIDCIDISYNIQKVDYPTFESLRAYVIESNIF